MVAPSANRSGHVSPTSAAHVLADLRGRIDMVIDAGPCPVGVESTIVACLGEPTLLRPGGLPREADRARARARALAVAAIADDAPLAPGMLSSHYAPKARLRLNAEAPRPGEALLAFGPAPAAGVTLNLSPRGDLIEAAANLFSHLRALDASGAKRIAVMKVPHEGLGEAINDRLARAAAPKAGTAAMNLQSKPQPMRALAPDLLARFVGIVGAKYAITDRAAQEPYLVEMRDLYHGQHAGGAAAGLGRRSGGDPQARQRDQDRDRAAGRQYRAGRRANPASRRGRALAHPARQDPRGRCRSPTP